VYAGQIGAASCGECRSFLVTAAGAEASSQWGCFSPQSGYRADPKLAAQRFFRRALRYIVRITPATVVITTLVPTTAALAPAHTWEPRRFIRSQPSPAREDWSPCLAITPRETVWDAWLGIDAVEGDDGARFSRWNGQSWDPPRLINPPNQPNGDLRRIALAPTVRS
jgi:hypothetical protein